MSLLSLVAALVLEQWRPLADRRYLYALLARYATFLEGLFNAGEARQGAIAWLLTVLPVVFGAWLVYAVAYRASPFFALLLNVGAVGMTPASDAPADRSTGRIADPADPALSSEARFHWIEPRSSTITARPSTSPTPQDRHDQPTWRDSPT